MKDRIVFNHSKQELLALSEEQMDLFLDLIIDLISDLPEDGEQNV